MRSTGVPRPVRLGLSEPEFYGDLYKFKKIVGRVDFSNQFRKIIVRYKRIGYNINIMRQSACLMFNPITVYNFASPFHCTPVGRASDSMVVAGAFLSVAWPTGVQLLVFFCSSVPVVLFDSPGISRCRSQHVVSVKSSSLFHHSIYL